MSLRFLRRPLSIAAVAMLAMGPTLMAPALAEGTKDDKVAERETIDQRIEDLRMELDGVNDDLAETYLALAETELLIPEAQTALDEAREDLRIAEEEDRKAGKRLSDAEEEETRLMGEVEDGQDEVDRSDGEMAQVALSAYKGGGLPNPASVYIGGESPQDTVDRSMNYRLTMASQGTRLDTLRTDQAVTENSADRLEAVREEIADLKVDAEEAVERTAEAKRLAEDAKQELDDLYARQQIQRDDLEAKKSEYQDEESRLSSRSSTLDEEITELARKEREAEERRGNTGGGAPVVASGDGWHRPVSARLNSNFGWRVHPIYRTRKLHSGVDFPAACGTPVGATQSGRVIQRTYNNAAGNKIVLSHGIRNGKLITSSYHHLQGFAQPVGAQVSAGQTVGYVGSTGGSTGCHLHFEIHEDGNAVNPAQYL